MKQITYAIERDTGLVISRVGSKVCIPVLDFEAIGKGGDFTQPLEYHPERFPITALAGTWHMYKWTKKIPLEFKNMHREFWGMRPLRASRKGV